MPQSYTALQSSIKARGKGNCRGASSSASHREGGACAGLGHPRDGRLVQGAGSQRNSGLV